MRVDGDLDPHRRLGLARVAAVVGDGLADHAQVHVEADALDVAGLVLAQEVACAAELQVAHGDGHAGAQVGVGGHGREALVGGLRQRLVGRVQEVGVAALAGPADAAAELVQLRQAHHVGAVDDQRVGALDVQARLDDGCADQHVGVALPEVLHDLLEARLAHLAVRGRDPRLGHEFAQPGRGLLDRADTVVHEERLPLPGELATQRGLHLRVVVGAGERQHGVALLRRGRDDAHLPDAGDRDLEGARDRRGRHRQHVDVDPHGLQAFLVLDAEALLLVDDDQAEVLELHLLAEQAMGADDDVDLAVGDAVDDLAGLGVALEARQLRHADGEPGEAGGERRVVLRDEQRRRHEHRDLLAVLDGLEGGAHGDLGLAVADVAADEAVHRDKLLHVGLHLGDGGELVRGLDVAERVLEFPLPGGVGAERVALGRLAGGVELDELTGDLPDGLAGLRLALGPVGAAHLVERRGLRAHVAAELVELVHRDEQPVAGLAAFAGRVLDDEVVAGGALDGAADELDEPADAVGLVHDGVARLQLERLDGGLAAAGQLAFDLVDGRLAGQLGRGEDLDAGLVGAPALPQRRQDDRDGAGGRRPLEVADRGTDARLVEQFDETLREAATLDGDDDPPAVPDPAGDVLRRNRHVAVERLGGVDGQSAGVDGVGIKP